MSNQFGLTLDYFYLIKTLNVYLVYENARMNILLIFSLFLYLDNLNNYDNKIKSDSNGNEISLLSGISGNILISWSKLFFKYF